MWKFGLGNVPRKTSKRKGAGMIREHGTSSRTPERETLDQHHRGPLEVVQVLPQSHVDQGQESGVSILLYLSVISSELCQGSINSQVLWLSINTGQAGSSRLRAGLWQKQVITIGTYSVPGPVYMKSLRGGHLDLGRAWISSAKGVVIVPTYRIILRVFFKKCF